MPSSASKKLLKELPSREEMKENIQKLESLPDAAAVMMAAAYLDHGLQIMLRALFIELPKEELAALFEAGGAGSLSSTSQKARMAYALGLLSKPTYDDLKTIITIRNVFAHSLHEINFEHPKVQMDLESLEHCQTLIAAKMPGAFIKSPKYKFLLTVDFFFFMFTQQAERMIKTQVSYRMPDSHVDAPIPPER